MTAVISDHPMVTLYRTNSEIAPDERDRTLLLARLEAWEKRTNGPRVGDFVMLSGDRIARFTHDWGDGIQTTWKGESGSFYLSADGYAVYSGGLEPPIQKTDLVLLDEVRAGRFWFFHHDHSGAHRGVGCTLPCRVYRLKMKE